MVMKCLFAFLFAAVLLSGCATIKELPYDQAVPDLKSQELKLGRTMVTAFMRNEPESFIREFSSSLKNFDSKTFEKTRKEVTFTLGDPESFQYVTSLEFVTFKAHFWKIRFRRKGNDGKEYLNEALLRIITGRSPEGKIIVLGFNFV